VVSRAAFLLNNTEDGILYQNISNAVRQNWISNFYNPQNYTFEHGWQTSQALSLWLGVVPEQDMEGVVNYLINNIQNVFGGHMSTGIVGAKYLMESLSMIGRSDLAYQLASQTSYPSWGYWTTQEGTTLWESWEGTEFIAYGSLNHIMFGSQSAWYFKALAGINTFDAYSTIFIRPEIYQVNLTQVSASMNTHKGMILSSWEIPNNSGMCTQATENQNALITCLRGVITSIVFASFGTPTGSCGNFAIDPSCHANDSVSIVSNYCIGKSSCSIPATVSVFGDPCFGTVKRLYVQAAGCQTIELIQSVVIPVNSISLVQVPKMNLTQIEIFESGTLIWQNDTFISGDKGVMNGSDKGTSVEFAVGSGSYIFQMAIPLS